MKRCISGIILILIVLIPEFLYPANRIDAISFKGNSNISSKEIYKAINYDKKVKYRFDNLSKFKKEILKLYKNNGFFDAEITYELVKKEDKNNIVFDIKEGEQYRIGEIDVEGNSVLEKKQILKLMNLKINSPAKIENIKKSELSIGKYYSDLGYLYANVFTKIDIMGKAAILLKVIIDEGSEVYVNSIDIKNLGKINKRVVTRELELKRGAPCSYGKLIKSQSKMFETGLFSDVHFKIEGMEDKKDSVDIVFYLTPAKTHWIFAGLSYETPDIMAVNGEWGFNNLFNMNNWIKFKGRVAYSIHSGYQYRLNGYYLNPYFLIKELSLKLSVDYYDKIYRDYIDKSRYVELSLGKQWLNNNFISFNLNIQNSSYDSIIGGVRIPQTIYYTNSAYMDLNRDYTDNFMFPKRGFRYYLKLQYSGGILRGNNNFYKGYFSVSCIKNFKNFIFSAKNQIGSIIPFYPSNITNISYDQEFRLGGAYNLRGYNENSLGTADIYNNYGGLNLLCINLETTSPSIYNFSVSVFMDMGVLNDTLKSIFKGVDYKYDAGIGIRYITPIGPIRLDWAYPFDGSNKYGKLYLAIGTIY